MDGSLLAVTPWAVIDTGWRFEIVRLSKVTAQQAHWDERGRTRRVSISAVMGLVADEVAAKLLADRLESARAECHRRERAAREWFAAEKARLRSASRTLGADHHG